MQSCRSVPVNPAHFELDEVPPLAELESLELLGDAELLLGDVELVLGEAELLLGDVELLLGDAVPAAELPGVDVSPPEGVPALEPLLVASLPDDPLDDAPPELLPLAPALAPPALPPPAPPAPPPCAHDALARPNIAAVMAALMSLDFIAWFLKGWGGKTAPLSTQEQCRPARARARDAFRASAPGREKAS
jgi:hypothetical protein